MQDLEHLELRIMELEQRLRPIADRPVDLAKPGWADRLVQSKHPLDEVGIRPEAETLLQELIGLYGTCVDVERRAIRALCVEYRAFAWAAGLSFGPIDEEMVSSASFEVFVRPSEVFPTENPLGNVLPHARPAQQ